MLRAVSIPRREGDPSRFHRGKGSDRAAAWLERGGQRLPLKRVIEDFSGPNGRMDSDAGSHRVGGIGAM